MKLFWGLIETHEHTFDATNWKAHGILKLTNCEGGSGGGILYYINTCSTCGYLIERKFKHT